MKYNILIGGSAGQGMDTLGLLIEKILKGQGFYVYSCKDYMSRVRGGHNFIQIRFGSEPVYSHWPELDVIIALDKNTVENHINRLKDNGVVLCDEDIETDDTRVIRIPMKKIGVELGNNRVGGSAAVGAVIRLFNQPSDIASEIFNKKFSGELGDLNLKAFQRGYDSIEKRFEIESPGINKHIFINGNQAIALGALAGGVSFYASYPMTPATSVMAYLAMKQKEAGIAVEQVEDEIAAINMALGASYAGARAMTGTSGGGLALMVEGLSLEGVMEVPIVVVDSQRPGPATGLPTRTGQEDLSFVLSAGHGEFPRMVIAVKNPEDAFYQTARALNIADKYQMLVILLTDQYLADASQTIPPYDFTKIAIDRYLEYKENGSERHKRYKFTKSGVSPRLIPGKTRGKTVLGDCHVHNEYGHISESDEMARLMAEKRMRKLEGLKKELQEPDYFGVENPETLLIGWGSMHGPLKEGVELLAEEGISIGALVFGDIYPLPKISLNKYASTAKKIVNVEQNYGGQFGRFIRQETGIAIDYSILQYDGRQMSSKNIYSRVKEEVL